MLTDDGDTTVRDSLPPAFLAPAPIVLACTGCKAQYRELPDDAACTQDGHPVQTGPDPLIGRLVAGRWRILRFVGAGGMACVYAAEHHRLGTRCALKVIWGDLLDDERANERFVREAEACRDLLHRGLRRELGLTLGGVIGGAGRVTAGLRRGSPARSARSRRGSRRGTSRCTRRARGRTPTR